jgi:hypothetical protein
MATINTTDPKPGFVYDLDTDTWFPLQGIATTTLDALSDVVITSPVTNQALVYNGTNWINATESGDITAVSSGTGITVTNGTGPIPTIAIDTASTVDLNTAQTLTNKLLSGNVLLSPEERWTVTATAATGTVNLDVLTAGVYYSTASATGNWTLNVRGSSSTSLNSIMATNDSITVVMFATQGSPAYYQTALNIDGSAVTPKWQNGVAPAAGNANSIDIYSFTIVKTGSATFTAFGSQTRFA